MSKTWEEVVNIAMGETYYSYQNRNPTQEEFVETFMEFYNEEIATTRILSWPVDPPSSHRMAKGRATVEYADEF